MDEGRPSGELKDWPLFEFAAPPPGPLEQIAVAWGTSIRDLFYTKYTMWAGRDSKSSPLSFNLAIFSLQGG